MKIKLKDGTEIEGGIEEVQVILKAILEKRVGDIGDKKSCKIGIKRPARIDWANLFH